MIMKDNNRVEIVSDSSTLILLARSGAIEKMIIS